MYKYLEKIYIVLGLIPLLLFLNGCKQKITPMDDKASPIIMKKKIIRKKKLIYIFSSTGGGAHSSAAAAIKSYLEPEYQVEITNIFSEIMHHFDPFKKIHSTWSGEKIYNYFLQRQSTFFAETFASFGSFSVRLLADKLEHSIESFLFEKQPDGIISVIPIINGSLYTVAHKLDIPFAVIALDLDLTSLPWCNGIYAPTFKKFFFAFPIKHEKIEKTIKKLAIPSAQVFPVGFPVRLPFLSSKLRKKRDIKNDFSVALNKPVVMVLMGGEGSSAIMRYARTFSKKNFPPLHIIFCIGKNDKLKKKIEKISFPPHLSISIVGFTERIAELMHITDILITKPGPTSIFEALYTKIPTIIIDRVYKNLRWEQTLLDFIVENNIGTLLRNMHRLKKMIKDALTKGQKIDSTETTNDIIVPDVVQNIKSLIKKMLDLN